MVFGSLQSVNTQPSTTHRGHKSNISCEDAEVQKKGPGIPRCLLYKTSQSLRNIGEDKWKVLQTRHHGAHFIISCLVLKWFINRHFRDSGESLNETVLLIWTILCVSNWEQIDFFHKDIKLRGWKKISVSRLLAHRSHLIHWANTESEFYVSRLTDGSPCPACRSEHPTSVFWQRLGWHCEDEKGL